MQRQAADDGEQQEGVQAEPVPGEQTMQTRGEADESERGGCAVLGFRGPSEIRVLPFHRSSIKDWFRHASILMMGAKQQKISMDDGLWSLWKPHSSEKNNSQGDNKGLSFHFLVMYTNGEKKYAAVN